MPLSKPLHALIEGLSHHRSGDDAVAITDVVFDSRKVTRGSLFVAIKGLHHDGHAYIPKAVSDGAAAVLTQQPVAPVSVPVVQVADTLRALTHVALRFWGNPSTRLRTVGITGTNGKTTTSYLMESIFKAAGWPCGVMGTINYRIGDRQFSAPNTTPFSSEIHRFMAQLEVEGGQACIMEVSSHALELGRVEGLDFDCAVFTNLTQDHLDFHKTLEAYAAAKAKLFAMLPTSNSKGTKKAAVVNGDDAWSKRMADASRVPVLVYRMSGPADFYADKLHSDATGSRFDLVGPGFRQPVRSPLLGHYNVMNSLAAAAAGFSQGLSPAILAQGLETVNGVPGRLEPISEGQSFTVVVDYAHTDDALRQVLKAMRALNPRRLITVFGCGGDRDRTKRPLMGEAAAQLSDEIIVTSDNPRSEDPEKITLDIEVGVRRVRSTNYRIILDREEAIAKAFTLATEGDLVLIAGKGHENYQILRDKTIAFDDREVARRLLRARPHSSL